MASLIKEHSLSFSFFHALSFTGKGCLVMSSHLIPGKKYSLEETSKIPDQVSEHKNDIM